ncbi:hypothetical protein Xind_03931 [Xenorhabdus indica]|nr:hypothetical protein [Xenorhabdus indica]
MRNTLFDECAVIPKKPQAVRNRRARKRRIALFTVSLIVFIPV